MKKFIISGVVLFCSIILLMGYVYNARNAKTFSSTQTWEDPYASLRYGTLTVIPNAYDVLTIPAVPKNNSKQTRTDLQALHHFEAERSAKRLYEIELEKEIERATFGNETLQTIVQSKPNTNKFIETPLIDLTVIILHYKNDYDRIRPSYLDKTLTTTIAVPPHPSYPSGHATQSYFIALMLAELDPKNKEVYMESAYRIGHNREIAGLHYPSDSEAGRELADQYFKLIKETDWYKTNLAAAQKEWSL